MNQAAATRTHKPYSSDLSPRAWRRLAPLLVVERRSKWPLAEGVNPIRYGLKNDCVWRDLPGDFLPWSTVYWYFTQWEDDGT